MRALVIGEVNAAGIKPTAASLVTAAVKAAGVTDMLLLGQGQSAQDVAKTFSGVETVFVNPADGENILTESLSKAVVALVKEHGYSHVFFEASSMGKSVMPVWQRYWMLLRFLMSRRLLMRKRMFVRFSPEALK